MDWYPKYPIAYMRDTARLSFAEDGAYNRLLDWYYLTEQPLPDDDVVLAGILRSTPEKWAEVAVAVRAFFIPIDGLLLHKRCDQELGVQKKRKKRRVAAAHAGAKARHSKKAQPQKTEDQDKDKENNELNAHRRATAEKNLPNGLPIAEPCSATGQDRTVVVPKSMTNVGATAVQHRDSQVETASDGDGAFATDGQSPSPREKHDEEAMSMAEAQQRLQPDPEAVARILGDPRDSVTVGSPLSVSKVSVAPGAGQGAKPTSATPTGPANSRQELAEAEVLAAKRGP